MSTYYTQGIILKKTDRGEADQLFNIYTFHRGKAIALGRGTKKIVSKLNGSLQSFALLNLMIAPGKYYDHIAGVSIVKNYPNIKTDLKKIILGSFGLETIDKLTRLEGRDDRIFTLLVTYFEALEENDFLHKEWELVKQAFTVKLLSLLGFDPPVQVAEDSAKLDSFLRYHLDSELNSVKFISRFGA